jgi:predicted alpha-1,2-mannosidase
MRRFFLIILSSLLMGFYSCPSVPSLTYVNLPTSSFAELQWVDPMIGSGGFPWARGNVSPAASAPFGRIRVGPDTDFFGKRTSTSGYASSDTHLLGFSHTRLSGTGAFEGGLLRMLPSIKKVEDSVSFRNLKQVIDRRHEKSNPGYYSIYLPNSEVQVELAASQRSAIHRYRFQNSDADRYVYFDLRSHLYAKNSESVKDVLVNVSAGTRRITVSGKLNDAFSSRYGGLPFFLVVESDTAWFSELLMESSTGPEVLRLGFGQGTPPSELIFRVGLSYTNEAGAARVLNQENLGLSLETILTATWSSWQDLLSRIKVEGGSDREKRIFYTSLYRSFLMPNVIDDPNGASYEYMGFDKTLKSSSHPVYSDFSLWDTFRTLHPLYNLVLKDRHPEMLNSLILMADQLGFLPRWPSGVGETGSMLGLPAGIVMAEAAQKNIGSWNEAQGYSWFKQMTVPGLPQGQEHLSNFVTLGYSPISVSHTIEYSYAFESLSKWASLRGENEESSRLHSQALGFKNHWSSARGFFVPKDASGKLDEGISEADSSYLGLTRSGKAFVEGTAWHWAFSPFILSDEIFSLDPNGFISRLDRFMNRSGKSLGAIWPIGGYWHGNEHDFHAPWLFALHGRADLTQKWVDFVMREKYADRPMGLDGDDDGGSMSSWYVWAALGLFPIAGSDRFVLGAPVFDRVIIEIGNGEVFEISASGIDTSFVSSASLQPATGDVLRLTNPWLTHSQMTDGSKLIFERSSFANAWKGGNP